MEENKMIVKKIKLGLALAIISLIGISSQAFPQDCCPYDIWSINTGM
jgi:hypothetical protein